VRSVTLVASPNFDHRQSAGGHDAGWSVYFAVTPNSPTMTLSEELLKRALNRQAAEACSVATKLTQIASTTEVIVEFGQADFLTIPDRQISSCVCMHSCQNF